MNAMDITCQNPSSFARFVRRSVMLIALLFAFTAGASAQRYYVMYYEKNDTRHYLAISEDGNSLTNETELSLRCYWVADGDLETVNAKYNTETLSGANENARKPLRSYTHRSKSLIHNSEEVKENAKNTVFDLILSPTSASRWLMDNNNLNDTPVLYYWNYKHYVYFDDDNERWKYCSNKDNKYNLIKIESCSLLLPPLFKVKSSDDGKFMVTISANEGCSIFYAIGDSEEFQEYKVPINNVEPGTIIKAYSMMYESMSTEEKLVLPSNLEVVLNDSEDHGWTYYSGVDNSVDNNNYVNNYKGYIYSPNPRNVKITYDGNGGAVSINEPETKFVYYKTLEQGNTEGEYPYTVISNPFSVRPSEGSGDSKVYYGFNGWKIISGGEYIKGYDNGATLPLDAEIIFEKLPYNSVNCISANIELQTTWVPALVTYLNEVKDDNTDYTFNVENNITENVPTTYENNFLVINKDYTGNLKISQPCTIMMVEPDGSNDYRGNYPFTGSIIPDNSEMTKIEYAHWNPIVPIDAKGRNFTIGRGMKMNMTASSLYGTRSVAEVNQILKIESGKYNELIHYADGTYDQSYIQRQRVTLGCDYDRARSDNSKLEFTGRMYVGHYCTLNLSPDQEMCRVYGLSGRFMTQVDKGSADWQQCYYMSVSDAYNKGRRYMEIQGGEWLSITGGTDYYDPSLGLFGYENYKGTPSFTFRMKGGHIKGSIYGAAAYYDAVGTRTFVITGGTINGWVAGGANGTRNSGGAMEGATYVYVGGNARVDSNGSTTIINRAIGGNVFGAGCGYSASSTSGQVTEGTNVVIADYAYVERGVYGGGSYGYCATDKTSNIYITGGTVGGITGGVNGTSYVSTIKGGVFGGACQNMGGDVNIYMTGGKVNGGLYGGSNESGTLSGNVNMKITGGTVGTDSKEASVYGGGYGSGAAVSGNIDLRMTGGLIHGNIFGGGNAAAVEGNTSVTITSGEVKRNVYGGGNAADVSGTTNVVIGQGT